MLSVVSLHSSSDTLVAPYSRKRTTSFSRSTTTPNSRPAKCSRIQVHRDDEMGGLKRTASFLDLSVALDSTTHGPSRAILHMEDVEDECSSFPFHHYRTTSPLSPTRRMLPPRASFPRSKSQPDLYKMAIITRMRESPQGQQILQFGPRVAVQQSLESQLRRNSMRISNDLWKATLELERIVRAQQCDPFAKESVDHCNSQWVVVPLEDWEMVGVS